MVDTQPNIKILTIPDPGLADGVTVNDALTVPDGYNWLLGTKAQGTGLESVAIKFNDASESQDFPGVDLATDANATQNESPSGPLSRNGFNFCSQPVKPMSKMSYTPSCTGTAVAFYHFMFSRTKPAWAPPYTLYRKNDTAINTSSAASGAKILGTVPTQSGNIKLTKLAAAYGHGATSNSTEISMGQGGPSTAIPVQVGAVNTIEHPAVWTPIDAPLPSTINFVARGNGTGAAQTWYFAIQ